MIKAITSLFRRAPEPSPPASTVETTAPPQLVPLEQCANPQCPLELLREISDPNHVRDFLAACVAEVKSSLDSIEAAVRDDSECAALRASLHRLRNAFSNACLNSHVAAMPPVCDVSETSAHYHQHLPVLRALGQQALQYMQSQPEIRDLE